MPRLAALLAVLALAPAAAQSPRPLPDPDAFFAEARKNLARSTQVQYEYGYKERRAELHMNPFGRLGTGDVHVYEYTPGPTPQVAFRRLVERDGTPVTDAKVERQERRPQTGRSIEDVVNTLRFTIDRREHRDGRDTIVVQFEPRPNADPQTRQGRIAKVLKGTIWIDEASREVMRMEGTAMDDVSYGLGIVARINKGAALTVTRERADGDVWLPTSVRMKGNGRALLVRRMSIDYFLEWFDYKRPNP